MEEGTSNGSSPWMPNSRDDKKKLRSLKRKYRLLEEENATLSEEVVRSRRLIARLQNERGFILNRLLKLDRLYRTSDTDSDSGGSSSESELEQSDAAPVKRKENGISPTAKRQKTVAGPPSIINVDPESLGLCTAVVRGRPCKSKSLSGYKFCWHHAPLDPNSPFTWCQFQGTLQKSKKCSIPVLKTKVPLLCKYHSQEEGAPGTATASPAGETKEKEKEKEQEVAQDKGLEELKSKRKDKKEKKKDKKEKKKKRRRERRAKKEENSKQKGGVSGLQLKAIGGLNGTPMVDDNSIHLIDEDISVGSGDESPRGQLVISEDSEDSEDEGRGMSIADMEEDVQDV